MRLITEMTDEVQLMIEEIESGKKNYYIEGIFMSSDVVNRNGRYYPKSVMESSLGRYMPAVLEKRVVGELNHPSGPSINLDKVSHLITNLQFKENHIIGKAKILDTPMGNIAKGLLEGGVKLGVSSRGLGSLKEVNGRNEVQSDFMISAVDIVADPSAPDAYVNGIMEGKEWVWENGLIKEAEIAEAKKELLAATPINKEEVAVKLMEAFFERLKSKAL